MKKLLDAWAHEQIIINALENGDQKTIEEYKPFDTHHASHPWGMALNRCGYEHFLQCGFKGAFKDHLDDYGWFEFDLKPDEVLTVYEEKHKDKFCRHAFVSLAHLPNGRWVSGLDAMFSKSGFMGGADIYSRQFDTRQDALRDVLKVIIGYMDGESDSIVNTVKKRIAALWGTGKPQRREPIQLELF